MSITKKPYEISLWEDNLVFVGKSGEDYMDITEAKEEIVAQYYKETRLCTIGSDSMDSPARAVNGKLVRKVNGEVTFTFTVYYRYYDNQTGQLEYNPFVSYLTNERKVKLKYDDEWYDLIIKQIQENSESKAFTYTCKSQFVNELSKTGFELEFDNELQNNMGTVEYLAEQILEGSDWKLEGNSSLRQFIEEPLYRITLGQDISAKDMDENKDETIGAGQKIYAFYSQINDKKAEIQFLFANTEVDENGDNKFIVNDDLIIDKEEHHNYVINNVEYDEKGWPKFVQYIEEVGSEPIALAEISAKYRGMRLVKQARTIYDAKIDKYVQEYTKAGDNTVYYGFEETKYLSPNAVNNYVVNPNAFTSTSGWYVQPNAEGAKATLELVSDPPFEPQYQIFKPQNLDDLVFCYELQDDEYVKTADEEIKEDKTYYRLSLNQNFTSYLKFPNNGGALVNSSINSHKSSLEGFVKDETTYVLRIKCKKNKSDTNYITPKSILINQYEDMTSFETTKEIFRFALETISSTNEQEVNDKFTYYKATCLASVTEKELKNWDNYYGLFLFFDKDQYTEVYIEDIQLFPYMLDNNQRLCVPDGELFAKVETTKKYYNPLRAYSSLEEIEFEPAQPEGTYQLKYAEGEEAYTKVSSITAKESNRFNLLQDLNEKFECWARFRVEHDPESGKILYGKDVGLTGDEAYRQQKFVSFHEYAGKHNYAGFKYGVNSKSIQRTLDSNAIVSKMIVKDNANEFARNGFCSIARAVDNSSKENFVLNFDHYYRHGLLDLDVVTNDLYVTNNGYLGYYKQLKEINRDREALIDEQANLLKEIANYEAQYQTYKTSHDSAIEERNQMEDNIFLLIVPKEKRDEASSWDFPDIISTYSDGWEDNSSYIKYTTSWMQCDNVIKQHLPLYQKAYEHLNGVKDENGITIKQGVKERYEEITELLKGKTEQKRALNLQFYKKYSRFIQEGSWIKEDYVDDNLYYLDSLSTLHTSAQPKVTYNISVVDVSPLPGYDDYDFNLGDITYIEDREFFGYSLIDGTTPYREEIVVSEITAELDAPEKNSIKVQNYKTQFEDLFQRITAQTQQAEYHTGEYKRAASIVEPGGNISVSTLENSFANNSFKLSNVRDQSVIIDSSGITTTSLANPSEMVRIVNGGIFMSTDGGQSWKTGLTGYGLNSSYLTAGQINTDEIYIMSGNQPAFGWDEKGISAYSRVGNTYNLDKFVRFDQYGLYGIANNKEFDPSIEEEGKVGETKIWSNATYALTWSGFMLKNGDGSVKITSEDDIQVVDNDNIPRLKIGRLATYVDEEGGQEKTIYGIRILNQDGQTVMETGDDGELWLKNQLKVEVDSGSVSFGRLTLGQVINASNRFIVYQDGTVSAEAGSFTGTINANQGRIGKLQLINNSLIATSNEPFSIKITDSQGNTKDALMISNERMSIYGIINAQDGGNIGGFKIQNNKLVSVNQGVQLDGIGNKIIANSIELGTGAIIKDYIQLGEALIQNPLSPDIEQLERPFILAGQGKLEIYQDGLVKSGNITIDGKKSEISGSNFSITPEVAYFKNIIANGSIETVVFKQGHVQAAGGAMIFSPSYKIEDISGQEVYLDQPYEGDNGDIVWLASSGLQEKQVKVESIDAEKKKVKLSEPADGYIYGTLIKIGAKGSLVMGVNSGNSKVYGHLLGRGLTINELGGPEQPKLFLGDLAMLGLGFQGYGLYSDNVYLNGSLTTKSGTGKYAGVNTLTGVSGDIDTIHTDAKIIFWAGADDETDEAIKRAPFQVSEDGNVYLKNSLFAGGIITGTELRATKIRGWNGDDAESALSIYDTSYGISFKTEKEIQGEKKEEEIFAIDSTGLRVEDEYFIKIEEGQAILKTRGNSNYIAIQEYNGLPALYHHHSDTQWCGLFFDNNQTSFRFRVGDSETLAASFANNAVIFGQDLELVSGDKKMQYKSVNNGYDLYIV